MIWNIPNALTLSRLLLLPVILHLFQRGESLLAFAVFGVAALTDFFDGKVARALKQETHFGAIFDPIADRIFSIVLYTYVAVEALAPPWLIAVVLARNISQLMSVPILIWWLKRKFFVKPKLFSKWATVFSDVYLFAIFFDFLNPGPYPMFALSIAIASIELKVLFDYLPRLIGIARGTHDTFE